jgi:hypothetical protein
MFTMEEKKNIRNEFWIKFKSYSNKRKLKANKSGKWMLDKTGIKHLNLKFHFDEYEAWAGIEIDTTNLDRRIDLFDKLEKLKKIITDANPHTLTWELEKEITSKKNVSRIFAAINDVNIYNVKCWRKVYTFLYEVMEPLEDIIIEYNDYLRYQ